MNPKTLHPQSIEDAWTLADTQAYLHAIDTRPDHTQADYEDWRTKRYRPTVDKMELAVLQHLAHLAQHGRLAMPSGSELAELPWLKGWRALLDGRLEGHAPTSAIEPFRQALSTEARMLAHRRSEGLTDEQVHQAWLDFVTEGNIAYWQGNARACGRFGHEVYAQSQRWRLELGTWPNVGSGETAQFVPLTHMNLVDPTLQHLTIPAPSGELWFSDWFRLDPLTNLLNAPIHELPSLDSEAGTAARAQHYAEQFGMGSIFVGNSSPRLVVRNGRILIGFVDEGQPDAPTVAGRVDTDLWRVSFIDKQVLADLVARVAPPEEVEAAMAQIREEVDVKLQVAPGTYHLYCMGEPARFPGAFAMEEEDLHGMLEPMAVVSPVALTPKTSLKPKRMRP